MSFVLWPGPQFQTLRAEQAKFGRAEFRGHPAGDADGMLDNIGITRIATHRERKISVRVARMVDLARANSGGLA